VKGKVYLEGAGPGDPDFLTLKAHRLIREADVILHDDLVGPGILTIASPQAVLRNVGKRCGQRSVLQEEINAQLIAFASFGLQVVRLKGGDPLLFGRAGEEMEAMRRARIEFEIVPGVTAAMSAAAAI
jgi:siroheme synthase